MAEIPTSNFPVGIDDVNNASKLVVVDFAVKPSRFAISV